MLRQDLEASTVATRHDFEVSTTALRSHFEGSMATLRHDLENAISKVRSDLEGSITALRHDMERLELRLTIRVGGMIAIGVAILAAIIKLLLLIAGGARLWRRSHTPRFLSCVPPFRNPLPSHALFVGRTVGEKVMSIRLLSLGLAGCLLAVTAVAQTAPPPTRIRGTIVALTGQTLTVKTREGPKADITLNDPLTVRTVKRLTLADIKEGTYVGIASKTGADGKAQALEVLVFPDAMRGAAEGHSSWDLQPGSMMTNANVTALAKGKSGNDLTLTYKDGTQQITVPPNAPIVTFAPATRSDLKPRARVILSATKDANGKLSTGGVTVGTHGVNPPM